MPDTPTTVTPDEWRSFLDKLDRLFDGYGAGVPVPETALGTRVLAVYVSEEDNTYDRCQASRPRRADHRRVRRRSRQRAKRR